MLYLARGLATSTRVSGAAAAAAAPTAPASGRVVRPSLSAAVAARYPKVARPALSTATAGRYPSKAGAAAPSSAAAPKAAFKPAPKPAARATSYSRPAATATATPVAPPVSDLDDIPFSFDGIEDYQHLAAPKYTSQSAPTPSPPLQSMPAAGYEPLPAAPASPASSSMPTITAVRARTQTDEIGVAAMGDGYVFKMPGEQAVEDWTTSFKGLSERPFDKDVAAALLRPLDNTDVEIKPDGLLYLPEIKYRRTLNAAFGPGGWGMAPRGETHIGPRIVSREWGLVCFGRLVAIARGEQEYFDPSGIPTATEACKSNALMRCCKDLGIASELWDPRFIRDFKAKFCTEAMVEHMVNKKKRKLWRMKTAKFDYPYKEIGR